MRSFTKTIDQFCEMFPHLGNNDTIMKISDHRRKFFVIFTVDIEKITDEDMIALSLSFPVQELVLAADTLGEWFRLRSMKPLIDDMPDLICNTTWHKQHV